MAEIFLVARVPRYAQARGASARCTKARWDETPRQRLEVFDDLKIGLRVWSPARSGVWEFISGFRSESRRIRS